MKNGSVSVSTLNNVPRHHIGVQSRVMLPDVERLCDLPLPLASGDLENGSRQMSRIRLLDVMMFLSEMIAHW